MNLREKMIDENFETCEKYKDRMMFQERSTLKRLHRDGVNTQDDFNLLSGIAQNLTRRTRNAVIEESVHQPIKCGRCGEAVIWMDTYKGKKVLIDAKSYNGEKLFMYAKHTVHWDKCDYANPQRHF